MATTQHSALRHEIGLGDNSDGWLGLTRAEYPVDTLFSGEKLDTPPASHNVVYMHTWIRNAARLTYVSLISSVALQAGRVNGRRRREEALEANFNIQLAPLSRVLFNVLDAAWPGLAVPKA